MIDVLKRFRALMETAPAKLQDQEETRTESRHGPGQWSKKEILGHLIDSAANNHQRFVRAQAQPELSFPGYEQEFWVSVQRYQGESWSALIALWKAYNDHLLHVLSQIPKHKLKHQCSVGGAAPVTLEFLATDYVRHMEHHLQQILGNEPQ